MSIIALAMKNLYLHETCKWQDHPTMHSRVFQPSWTYVLSKLKPLSQLLIWWVKEWSRWLQLWQHVWWCSGSWTWAMETSRSTPWRCLQLLHLMLGPGHHPCMLIQFGSHLIHRSSQLDQGPLECSHGMDQVIDLLLLLLQSQLLRHDGSRGNVRCYRALSKYQTLEPHAHDTTYLNHMIMYDMTPWSWNDMQT